MEGVKEAEKANRAAPAAVPPFLQLDQASFHLWGYTWSR